MKIMLVNGSPHKSGNTYTALEKMSEQFSSLGADTEIYWVGNKPVSGCTGCGACFKTGRCAVNDDVNDFNDKARLCDGFVFASPVHYAAASGALTSFMDRAFYCSQGLYRLRPAAAVAVARRAGTTATLDQINKYFSISEMPVVSGRYWNMVHGREPGEVLFDEEGLQDLRIVAKNMVYLINCMKAGEKAGITPPGKETVTMTNFIRK